MSGPNGEPHVPVGGAGEDDDDGDSFGEEAQSSAPARHRVRHAWLRRSPSCSEELDGEEPAPAEYAAINSMLDQISSCLDHLEEKNDYLHACLKELLESNRQTRLEFQQQSEQQNTEADVQGSQPPG